MLAAVIRLHHRVLAIKMILRFLTRVVDCSMPCKCAQDQILALLVCRNQQDSSRNVLPRVLLIEPEIYSCSRKLTRNGNLLKI